MGEHNDVPKRARIPVRHTQVRLNGELVCVAQQDAMVSGFVRIGIRALVDFWGGGSKPGGLLERREEEKSQHFFEGCSKIAHGAIWLAQAFS